MFSFFWPFQLAGGLVKLALNLIVWVSCVLTVTAFFGHKGWLWSLSSHFRMQYLVIQIIALLLVSMTYWGLRNRDNPNAKSTQNWFNLLFLGFFAGLNLLQILPYYQPGQNPPSMAYHNERVKLLHVNLFGKVNHHPEGVIQMIRDTQPDMIDLVEYTPKWQRALEASGVLRKYPYRVAGSYDIALYSKRPIRNGHISFASGRQRVANQANIIAQFTLNKQPVTILVAHPASPVHPSHLTWLQDSFASWIRNRKALGRNLLVVGDLNTSPWSVEFRHLTHETGLRDTQLGFGLQPSWPMLLPVVGIRTEPNWLTQLLQVPIDHVLISERLVVLSRHTGPFVGSDHLPVIVELGLDSQRGLARVSSYLTPIEHAERRF